jgi:hypothetical protein
MTNALHPKCGVKRPNELSGVLIRLIEKGDPHCEQASKPNDELGLSPFSSHYPPRIRLPQVSDESIG